MGWRSGYYSEAEPDFISPQASRTNRGVRFGSGSRSIGAALGGPGLHSRRSDHAGGGRRGDGLHGIDDNEEVNSRHSTRGYPGRPLNRGEGFRASLDGHNSAQGPPHDFLEEDDIFEATVHPRGPPRFRGGRQDFFGEHENHRGGYTRVPLGAQRDRSRGRRPGILREQHGFGDRNPRVNQIDEMDELSLPGFAERQPFGAAGAHPGRHHPPSQRDDHVPQGREPLRLNERHGGSRHGAGGRARSLIIDAYDEPKVGPSSALFKHPGANVAKVREKEGRFVPYTFRSLPPDHAEFLAKIFKVRMSKIKEWCEDDLIRLDKKLRHTNVDPLLSRLPSKDRKRYEHKLQTLENEREIEKRVGWPPRREPSAYELGFYAGQSSVLSQRRSGRHGSGRHR